jgi:hypothetical protein
MNLAELQKKLIAAARSNPPSERVPFAFEKRITALLASRPAMDYWAIWSRALWRGALGCIAIVMLLGAITAFLPRGNRDDLSQDFENTMLASADQDTADASTW